jgi:hypothetical protein
MLPVWHFFLKEYIQPIAGNNLSDFTVGRKELFFAKAKAVRSHIRLTSTGLGIA